MGIRPGVLGMGLVCDFCCLVSVPETVQHAGTTFWLAVSCSQ